MAAIKCSSLCHLPRVIQVESRDGEWTTWICTLIVAPQHLHELLLGVGCVVAARNRQFSGRELLANASNWTSSRWASTAIHATVLCGG